MFMIFTGNCSSLGPIFVSWCGSYTSNGRTSGSKAEMLQCRIWRFSSWMLSNQDIRKRSVLQKIWPAVSRICKIRNSFKSWMHIGYSYNHFNIQFISTFLNTMYSEAVLENNFFPFMNWCNMSIHVSLLRTA